MNEEDLVDESFNVGCINSNYIFCAKWGMEITEAQYSALKTAFRVSVATWNCPKRSWNAPPADQANAGDFRPPARKYRLRTVSNCYD
jgi:hypothetical protein